MRSTATLVTLLLLSGAFLFSACSSSDKATVDDAIPSWFTSPPEDPNYIFVPRTASSRDLQTAINRATTDARAEIGRVVEVRIEAMQKNFTEEVGVDEDATFRQMFEEVSRTVVATSLSGSRAKETKHEREGNMWRAYVLMEYPIGAANQQLMNQIKEREEMYTRFRQSQSFQELEKAVEDYEQRQDN
ncbi:MAG: hypothetical protein R6U28_07735 [Cyclonatronaceae bacterium]